MVFGGFIERVDDVWPRRESLVAFLLLLISHMVSLLSSFRAGNYSFA
jgi:hypothetical protein